MVKSLGPLEHKETAKWPQEHLRLNTVGVGVDGNGGWTSFFSVLHISYPNRGSLCIKVLDNLTLVVSYLICSRPRFLVAVFTVDSQES